MDRDGLLTSAKRWMHTGLAAYSRGQADHDFAVHHLGVATEHLLKAYLSSLHPALVVEAADLSSLLHATNLGSRAKFPVSRIKTLGIVAAYKRCRDLMPELQVTDQAFNVLAAARNGVAHVGIHDASEVDEAMTTCFRVADPLLKALQVDGRDFWGAYATLHEQMITKRRDRVLLAVTIKITKAKSDFTNRYGALPETQREPLIKAIALGSPAPIYDHAERYECPACDQKGWLTGRLDIEWVGGGRDDGTDDDLQPVVFLTPEDFTCPVCGLDLEEDELPVAGFPVGLPTDIDPQSYMGPDEDLAYDNHYDR